MSYMKLLNIKMDVKDRNELIAIAQDFIKYGYGYKSFITYDYPKSAIKTYGEDELRKVWEVAYNDYNNL